MAKIPDKVQSAFSSSGCGSGRGLSPIMGTHIQNVVKPFQCRDLDRSNKKIFILGRDKSILPDSYVVYFLFPEPIVRSSKLRSASSRPLLVAAPREKDDDLDSYPGWALWVVDRRPLPEPETSLPDRLSLWSPDELGRPPDMIALFKELLFRDKERGLSESGCWAKTSSSLETWQHYIWLLFMKTLNWA